MASAMTLAMVPAMTLAMTPRHGSRPDFLL